MVENPTALEAQASAKALVNARLIAEQMVQKSEAHLGHVISATANQNPRMMNGPAAIGGPIGGIGMGIGQGGTQSLAINSRRVEYNVSIYAVFAIE